MTLALAVVHSMIVNYCILQETDLRRSSFSVFLAKTKSLILLWFFSRRGVRLV